MANPVSKIGKRFSPARLISRRRGKQIIKDFSDKNGFVYFGRVYQGGIDRRIVRGLTVSNKHFDHHYCVGTYEGYDISFVERSDTLLYTGSKAKKSHQWHILSFDLLVAKDLPHIFVGMHTHSESFYLQLFTKYPHLRAINLSSSGVHKAEFLNKYRVYAKPGRAVEVESILNPLVTEMVSKHFGSLAIEIEGSLLYVYSENITLSEQLLDAMLKNGRWLADHIDRQADETSSYEP
jgi:hypothetical protein